MKFVTLPAVIVASAVVHIPVALSDGLVEEAPLDEYAGSAACAECHAEIYDKWSKRLKASFVRYRKDISGDIPGDWANSPLAQDQVFLVVGKKRKAAFVNRSWVMLPYEYHIIKEKWVVREKWFEHDIDYRESCASCHTVGFNPGTLQFKELNIGCESCHGPGQGHVARPSKSMVRVPGRTDDRDVIDTCQQCHDDRKKHARALKDFHGVFHED
jgi:hypothetical protein